MLYVRITFVIRWNTNKRRQEERRGEETREEKIKIVGLSS